MKTQWWARTFACAAIVTMLTMTAWADTIGLAQIPDWEPGAQTKLGWVFTYDDFNATVVPGWDRVVGGVMPQWEYTTLDSPAATWFIEIPNINERNPVKRLWISIVYDHIDGITGQRVQTDINGDFDYGYLVGPGTDPVSPLEVIYQGQFGNMAQFTQEYLLFPNPSWESIGFTLAAFTDTSGVVTYPKIREVYIIAECVVPEPATVSLLGLGLAGTALLRLRRKPTA